MSRIESLRIKAKLLQKSKKKSGKMIPLKEAYEIIAKSAGYTSWRAMKVAVKRYEVFRPTHAGLPYWNNWYRSYEDAKQGFLSEEHYLLPYENQFFICGLDYIEGLGIQKNDPDLALVGRDWVKPHNQDALERLMKKMMERRRNSGERDAK